MNREPISCRADSAQEANWESFETRRSPVFKRQDFCLAAYIYQITTSQLPLITQLTGRNIPPAISSVNLNSGRIHCDLNKQRITPDVSTGP